MNRGINGEAIFKEDKQKTVFLEMLAEKTGKFRMRLFAYCIMDNHYHLVLERASGRMSDFFRNLNTQYAFFYRKNTSSKGYVFQNRFVSTLVQDDAYLKQVIVYVLQNPVKAGVTDDFTKYPWSSAVSYFEKAISGWLDGEFVLGLFGSRNNLIGAMRSTDNNKLAILKTRLGPVFGDETFVEKALERFERRQKPNPTKQKRRDDFGFEPVAKVIQEFERTKGIKIEDINLAHWEGKRLRAELLARLYDQTGLKYREIIEIQIFSDLHYQSMSRLYHNFRKTMRP
ncbi:MAG: transposase [Candidatus Aminicenantes bacterium]|nr:transposase [Candidatus Aminicenantes bacterium]